MPSFPAPSGAQGLLKKKAFATFAPTIGKDISLYAIEA
jgi:hypothetical protein